MMLSRQDACLACMARVMWLVLPASSLPDAVVRHRKENVELKVVLGYVVSVKLAWAT